MNRIEITGRLTRDPECRYTQTGVAVTTFCLAVRRYTGKDNQNEQADFIDCVVWRVLAESCGNELKKGDLVVVKGQLQTRTYEAQDGSKRKVAEVVARTVARPLDAWEKREALPASVPQSNQGKSQSSGISSFGSEVLPDEDIPF